MASTNITSISYLDPIRSFIDHCSWTLRGMQRALNVQRTASQIKLKEVHRSLRKLLPFCKIQIQVVHVQKPGVSMNNCFAKELVDEPVDSIGRNLMPHSLNSQFIPKIIRSADFSAITNINEMLDQLPLLGKDGKFISLRRIYLKNRMTVIYQKWFLYALVHYDKRRGFVTQEFIHNRSAPLMTE